MFTKILIATDLSPASDAIVQCAQGFKRLGAEQVILCYALGLRHLEALRYELLPKVEPRLHQQQRWLELQGLPTVIEIPSGVPSVEINRIAEERDVSLIVIGSHGESMAHHLLFKFGGVASEVLHSHQKPLLLVRTRVSEDEQGEVCVEPSCIDFRGKVLYLTDFSDTAQRAFQYLEKIVESGCDTVTLMHVQDITRIGKYLEDRLEEFNRIDSERLEMLKTKLEELGARNVEVLLPYGHPTAEILQELRRETYSLVVMGSQGRGFIKEVFLGSLSCKVAREANTSVLLIPALR